MDNMSLYYGRDLQVLDNLIIKHPKLREIEVLNFEHRTDMYSAYTNILTLTPIDIADILWCEMKIWYKDATQWSLFLELCLNDSMTIDALSWYTGLDFVMIDDNGKLILYNEKNNLYVDEISFMYISQFLRKINFSTSLKLNQDADRAGNKLTAKYLLEKQYARRKRESMKPDIQVDLASIVSSLQFIGNKNEEIWDYPIYRIYEGYMRLNLKDTSDKTLNAYYSGNIDTSKTNIDFDKLNWSKIIKYN